MNYRLVQEFEVPDWIRKNTLPEDPNKLIQEFGAGKRQRKTVNYNEEFSEGQWLKIIEQGIDPQAEAEKIRNRRREMGESAVDGLAGKRRKLNDGNGYAEDEDDYDEEEDRDDDEDDYQYNSKSKQSKGNAHSSTKISLPNFGKQGDDDMDGLVQSDDQQE
jgi:hypothetical protein